MSDVVSKPLRRVHVHLRASEVGAPPLSLGHTEIGEAARPVLVPSVVGQFEVSDDRIEQAAREKFAADGYEVVENADHDIDISYDGEAYLIEAWVS